MQPILHVVSPIAAAAAGSLVASVWEGMLLAMAVWICLRALPGVPPATRSVIWLGVLLLVLLLPWFSFGMADMHGAAPAAHPEVLRLGERWSLLLAAVWAALSAWRIAQLAVSAARLRGLAKRAVPVTAPTESIRRLLRGSSRAVELCASEEVDRPSVAGFFSPRILIPPELLQNLSAHELEQVLLHELEHLRRRDDWTNLLQKLGLALLPLNPVLLWLDRRLCTERELACDDGVLRATNARKTYAACLAGLAEHSMVRRGVLLALGIFGRRRSELERRVYRILGRPENVMGPAQARVATGLVLAGAAFAAFALASSPKLVRFGPGEFSPAVRVQAATEAGPEATAPSAGTAHTMLVKAIVPAAARNTIPQTRLVSAMAMHQHRAAFVKTVSRKRIAEHEPRLVMTEWRADVTAPRLMLAIDQDSQIRYAAVAVRGGWLIVQL